jgi:hypothetical protein
MDPNEQRNGITQALMDQGKVDPATADLSALGTPPPARTFAPKSGASEPIQYSLPYGPGHEQESYRFPSPASWEEVAPGVSLSSFQNYNWQNDPGNRSLLNTTANYGMVPGPYSIGGLAANSFGTDPYANAANPALSGQVTPYGGSGPPAPGYFADLAGQTGVPGQPSIYQPGQPTQAPFTSPVPPGGNPLVDRVRPTGNPFDPGVTAPEVVNPCRPGSARRSNAETSRRSYSGLYNPWRSSTT